MKKTAIIIVLLVLATAFPAWADMTLNIKLNFFGPVAGGKVGPGVTTSFYLKSMVQRNLQVTFTSEALKAELRRTFNAPDVALLASADLVWRSGGPTSAIQVVQIDGRDYALVLTPLPRPGAVNFKVGVVEENDTKNIKNVLLDTEIVLPDGEVAMLGFRDSREHSYFIAFYVQGRNEEFGKDAVRLSGSKKPKMIKRVYPVYPAAALEKKIEGVVILEAVSDKYGKVRTARAISSPDPLLTEAALQAVKQWEYEPYIKDGKPKGVIFTATVTFSLDPEAKTKKPDNALTRLEDSQRPRLIKRVNPIYPAAALEKKIEGPVVMETVIDETGKVRAIRILNTPNQLLNDAALTAVKQWVYEPYVENGKAKSVVFTVTVTFTLNKE